VPDRRRVKHISHVTRLRHTVGTNTSSAHRTWRRSSPIDHGLRTAPPALVGVAMMGEQLDDIERAGSHGGIGRPGTIGPATAISGPYARAWLAGVPTQPGRAEINLKL
jgi:hypothetical protein